MSSELRKSQINVAAIQQACSSDKAAKRWVVETCECIATFKGHTGAVSSIAVSPDGTTVFTGSKDNTAKRWVVETGECIATFNGHTGAVNSIAVTSASSSSAEVGKRSMPLKSVRWLVAQ